MGSLTTRAARSLLEIPGVVGVGSRDPEGEREVIVYVEKPEVNLLVPRVFDGAPVRVVVSGRIRIYSTAVVMLSTRDRIRPAVSGVSISDPTGTAGTLGYYRNGFFISNAHVFGINWREMEEYSDGSRAPVYQPGVYDGGGSSDVIGYHVKTVLDEHLDLAIGEAVEGAVRELIPGVGVVEGWTKVEPGVLVEKVGRTTGHTVSTVFDTNATVKVFGYPGGERVFTDQIVMLNPGFLMPGDSGSLLFTRSGGKILAAGLCFAGSEVIAVANKPEHIVKYFDLGGYMPPPRPLDYRRILSLIPAGMPLIAVGSAIAGDIIKV